MPEAHLSTHPSPRTIDRKRRTINSPLHQVIAFLICLLALLPNVCQAQTYSVGEIGIAKVSHEPKQIELKWTLPPTPPLSGPPGPGAPLKVGGVSYSQINRYPSGMNFPRANLTPVLLEILFSAPPAAAFS